MALISLAGLGEVRAQGEKPATLEQLLERVREGFREEAEVHEQREAEFLRRKDEQAQILAEAQEELTAVEARGQELEGQFDENERSLAELEETLTLKMGTLGELFGVVRQVAGDARGSFEASLISAQLPGRGEFLENLAKSKELPGVKKLERLWFLLQQNMNESGKVVRFPATVVATDGTESRQEVVRIGPFNAIREGDYLYWKPEVQKLLELKRQPPARYLSTAESFSSARGDQLEPFAVDPSRGAILSQLVLTPDATERIEQGGMIGYVIIGLGVLGTLLALWRLLVVTLVGRRVRAQRAREKVRTDNPLGRVLAVYEENRNLDTETLELKLDEAILRESAGLERFVWAIKIISVVAPLLGLLGTVTGMIQTFQAITLFGAGDPKLMAGGISEALVTTMLGLCVAIPLVLLHSMVSSVARRTVQVLDEQSTGLVAQRAEEEKGAAAA